MAPMDMAASTTVVVYVRVTLRVTNGMDTVTGDVNQDIHLPFATKVRSMCNKLVDKRRLGVIKFHYTMYT